jgi:putative transposase
MRRWEAVGTSRFLTFSCYRRLPLLGSARIRDHFIATLAHMRARHGLRLLAWVVMPEHVHLLVAPRAGEASIIEALTGMKRDFGRDVIGRWRRLDARVLSRIVDGHGRYCFWQRAVGTTG